MISPSTGEGSSGLGEYWQNDLFTGSASMAIPIAVPPGRNGVQPQIVLRYNSRAGNGIVGVGWDLSMGYIQRNGKNGSPPNYNWMDYYTFSLAGNGGKLISIGFPAYRAEIEKVYMKFLFDGTNDRWIAYDLNGTKYVFGNYANSKIYEWGTTITYRWYLTNVEDTYGNTMVINYFRDGDNIQCYPLSIEYTNHPQKTGIHRINFIYELRPLDEIISYSAGLSSPVRTRYRLKEIKIYTSNTLWKRYVLGYQISPNTWNSKLWRITEYDGGSLSLPSTDFSYSYSYNNNFAKPGSGMWGGPKHEISSDGYPETFSGDFNGDGRTDLIAVNKVYGTTMLRVGVSTGNNSFSTSLWGWVNFEYHPLRLIFGDFNGDGKTDVALAPAGGTWHILISSGTGFRDRGDWGLGNMWGWGRDKLVVGDLNGDGKTDMALAYYPPIGTNVGKVHVWLSTGASFTHETWPGPYFGSDYVWVCGRGICRKDGDYVFGDFNGDGLTDILKKKTYTLDWEMWLSTGSSATGGFVYKGVWAANFTDNWAKIKPLLGDYNGDGMLDVANVEGGWLDVRLSTGKGFTASTQWNTSCWFSGQYFQNDASKIIIGDFNGDGKTDMGVWLRKVISIRPFREYKKWYLGMSGGNSANGLCGAGSAYWLGNEQFAGGDQKWMNIGDFDGDGLTDISGWNGDVNKWDVRLSNQVVPDLLNKVTNGLGGELLISYKPSSVYSYNEVPFVLQVVDSVTLKENSRWWQSTTYFSRQFAGFDYQRREFAGFAIVTATDSVGNKTIYLFNRGLYGDPFYFRGMLLGTILNGSDGKTYQKTTLSYYQHSPITSVYCPLVSEQITKIYDGQSATNHVTKVGYEYNQTYCDLTKVKNFGYDDVTGDEVNTSISYKTIGHYIDPNNRIIREPEDIWTSTDSVLLSRQWNYYDEGYSDVRGRLTRTVTWNNLNHPSGSPVTRYQYNIFGNVTKITDARGYETNITYDSNELFPYETTNALGQKRRTVYDARCGRIISDTDVANNDTTTYSYDTFCRPTKVIKPGDTDSAPTVAYFYNNFGNVSLQNIEVRTKNNAPGQSYSYIWTKSYFDGFQREYKTESSGDGGTIYTDKYYNVLGLLDKESAPRYSNESVKWTTYSYDPLRRINAITHPDNTIKKFIHYQRIVQVIDENGKKREYEKDAYGRITKVYEYISNCPSGRCVTTYQYNLLGNLISVTDAKGKVVQMVYDSLGRKRNMTDPDMGSWAYGYDANGNLTYQMDAKGQGVWLYYDALNRLTLKDYPPANPPDTPGTEDIRFYYDTDYTFDNSGQNLAGRLTKASDPYGIGHTAFSYDDRGRVSKIQKVIDGTVYVTQSTYDSMDRLRTLTYPDGEVVYYTYSSASGLLKTVIGSNHYLSNTTYNALGQITLLTSGNNAYTQYEYYSTNFRLYKINTTGPKGVIQNLTYSYDNVGNITKITDTIGTAGQDFAYDDLYRLRYAKGSYGIINIVYDEVGNRKTMTLGSPATKTVSYFYFSNSNRLQNYTDPEKEAEDKEFIKEAYEEMLKNIEKIARINNRYKECDEETADGKGKDKDKGCEKKEENSESDFPTYFDVVNEIYAEMANFTIKAKMDIWTFMGKLLQYPEVEDVLNRFNERIAEVGWYAHFDKVGEEIVEDFVDVLEDIDITEITGAEHDPVFSYDNNGNVIYEADSGMSIEWTYDNKVSVVRESSGNVVVQYFYDAFGARVKKVTQNATTIYIGSLMEIENTKASKHYFAGAMRIASRVNWDTSRASFTLGPWRLGCSCNVGESVYRVFGPYGKKMQNEFIANLGVVLFPLFMIILLRMGLLYYNYASSNHFKNILHILLIVSFLTSITGMPQEAEAQIPDPGTLVFYHTDHLGSTTALTDATGNVLQLLEYDPWGQVTKDIGDNYAHYRYTGQEYDPEIGLYNYKARLYAPGIGRFISADPIVPDPANPQALNRYTYTINNPLRYVDPSGYDFWSDLWKGIKRNWAYITAAVIVLATITAMVFIPGAGAVLAPVLQSEILSGIYGGVSAAQAGGDVGLGILFGVVVGGATAYLGGLIPTETGGFWAQVFKNFGAGFIKGFGFGATLGFQGGKGNIEDILLTGAIVGGIYGGLAASKVLIFGRNITYEPKVQEMIKRAEEFYGQDLSKVTIREGGLVELIRHGITPGSNAITLMESINVDKGLLETLSLKEQAALLGEEFYHVIQWQAYGPGEFLIGYINFHFTYGYWGNPFEFVAKHMAAGFVSSLGF